MTAVSRHSHQSRISNQVSAAIAVVLIVAALGATVVFALSWAEPTKLPQSSQVRSWDVVDLALGDGKVYVAWAPGTIGTGIRLAKYEGNAWNTSGLASPLLSEYVWAPTLAHSGTQLGAAWVQGSQSGTCDQVQKIVQMDSGGAAKTIFAAAYSPATAPDIAVGSSGWHLVFAAASSAQDCRTSKVNLYYTYRTDVGQPWMTPTVVMTHSAVVDPGTISGGIWYPHVAVGPAGSAVYVTWEQYQRTPAATDSSIWAITGTVHTGDAASAPLWSAPVELSPADQEDAVRPSIAADSDGEAHVVWTSLIGSRTAPTEQHVYYRALQRGEPIKLNIEPVRVTSNSPAVAGSSVSVLDGVICVTWHGYVSGLGGTGREEINLRCSDNGGGSWQQQADISASAEMLSIYPASGLAAESVIHAAWVEYVLDNDAWVPQGVYYRSGSPQDDSYVFLPLVVRAR